MSQIIRYLLLTLLLCPLSRSLRLPQEQHLRCNLTGPGGPKVGVPCVFPFRYESKTYDACTADTDPAGRPWCSTSVDQRGNHVGAKGNWGYCEPGCVTRDSGTASGRWLPDPAKLECGYDVAVGYIVGGSNATMGEFPFVALLGYRPSFAVNRTLYLCGGSLVNRRYVVTAAHCQGRRLRVREVVLGEFDVSRDPDCNDKGCQLAMRFEISDRDVILHHDWDPRDPAAGNDVALVRLPRVVDTIIEDRAHLVAPVCLPWRREAVSTKQLVVVGWGKTMNEEEERAPRGLLLDGVYERALQKLNVSRVPTHECEEKYGFSLKASYVCAGGVEGQDSCSGDSGGPLVAREGNEKTMFLFGIVSFGRTKCGIKGVPGVYLDVVKYLDWMKENLKD